MTGSGSPLPSALPSGLMSPRRMTFCCCKRRTKAPSLDCLTCPTGMTRTLTRAGAVKDRASRPMVALERRSRALSCLPCWMQMRSAAVHLKIHGRWSYACLFLSMGLPQRRSEMALLDHSFASVLMWYREEFFGRVPEEGAAR